jgi:hypothetical protein
VNLSELTVADPADAESERTSDFPPFLNHALTRSCVHSLSLLLSPSLFLPGWLCARSSAMAGGSGRIMLQSEDREWLVAAPTPADKRAWLLALRRTLGRLRGAKADAPAVQHVRCPSLTVVLCRGFSLVRARSTCADVADVAGRRA